MQPLVRRKAEHLGARGTEWLAQLPDLVSDLKRQWSITVGEPFSGGTTSYVCRAVTCDGDAAVLKLALPDDGFQDAVCLLEAADGNGYVRLLAHDTGRYALLQEALGASTDTLGQTPEQQMRVLGQTLQ